MAIREYGRHIQKMVDYLMTVEDKNKRQQQAGVLIELMGYLNPHLKNVEDFRHKLWDHLYYISDFQLDIDSPYPVPTKATYKEKPQPLPYPKRYPAEKHLGKNIEMVINKALREIDADKKQGLTDTIAYYIKLSYNNWHKENVSDQAVQQELEIITNGALTTSNSISTYKEREEFKTSSGRKAFVTKGNNNARNSNTNTAARNKNNNTTRNNNNNNTHNSNGNKKRYQQPN